MNSISIIILLFFSLLHRETPLPTPGFNVMVGSDIGYHDKCDVFIPRGYYVYVVSYELFGNESVLIKSGQYFNLDLTPLGMLEPWESTDKLADIESQYFQEIDPLIETISLFLCQIQEQRSFIREIEFSSKENIYQRRSFIEYFESKEIDSDLNVVLDNIKCYKEMGASKILFCFG